MFSFTSDIENDQTISYTSITNDQTCIKHTKHDQHLQHEQISFPFYMCAELTVGMFVVMWRYRLFICSPMFRRLFNGWNSHGRISKKVIDSFEDKASQASMEMMSYTFFAVLGSVLLWNKSWVWGDVSGVEELETVKYFPATVLWWNDQPNNLILTKDLMFFYLLYAVWYFERFISVQTLAPFSKPTIAPFTLPTINPTEENNN